MPCFVLTYCLEEDPFEAMHHICAAVQVIKAAGGLILWSYLEDYTFAYKIGEETANPIDTDMEEFTMFKLEKLEDVESSEETVGHEESSEESAEYEEPSEEDLADGESSEENAEDGDN